MNEQEQIQKRVDLKIIQGFLDQFEAEVRYWSQNRDEYQKKVNELSAELYEEEIKQVKKAHKL